jgi:hypothetical protein
MIGVITNKISHKNPIAKLLELTLSKVNLENQSQQIKIFNSSEN